MSFTKKINISSFGHYDYEALRDNAEMLLNIFKKNKLNAKISNKIDKNNINLIYEGHHPSYWEKVEEKLNKSRKEKNYLVVTEELTFSKFLNIEDLTFNQFETLYEKSIFKKIYRLKLLNFFYNLEKKINFLKEGLKKNIYKKILNYKKIDKYDIIMKDRYLFFLKILPYFDGVISTYDNLNYKKICSLKKKKYIFIPHLFDKEFLKNKTKKKKKINILFTGQINNYRKKIFSKIKYKIRVEKIVNYKMRDKLYNNSKILICLSKNQYQNKSSTNRTFLAIKKNVIPIIQKCKIEDQLDSFGFVAETENLNFMINKVLNNYKHYNYIFQKKRKMAYVKYNILRYKNKLIRFFN